MTSAFEVVAGMTAAINQPKSLDLVWGAREIAHLIGKTERATFHLLERGQLPARKVGNQWVARRQALAKHFEGEQV